MKKLKYFIYFLLMLLFAQAEILDGIKPFDIGFFIGLIYAGENMAVLAPLFVVAAFIGNPSVNTLILAFTTVILIGGIYFISYKLKKRVSLIEVNTAAVIARIPIIVINMKNMSLLTDSLITLVISSVFTYVAVISLYAIVKRGIRNRMTQDEAAASGIMAVALFAAAYNIDIFGYLPYYTISAFIIVMLVYNVSAYSLPAALLIGLGAAFATENLLIAAAIPLSAMVAMIFRRMPVAFIAGAYLIADVGAGFLFSPYGEYTLIHIIAVAAGLIAALIIPPKLHEKIRCETRNIRKGLAARAVINMNRYELSSQIASVGKAFNDIEISLKRDIGSTPGVLERSNAITTEICRKVCGSCERRDQCFKEDSDVIDLFKSIIKGASERGRATLVDVPPLLTSICKRINSLTETATSLVKACETSIEGERSMDRAKILLAEQSAGISSLMNSLSLKAGSSVSAEDNYEERIIEDLAYRNVICSEVLLWNSRDRGITLIVRQEDREKRAIDKVLFNRTGMKWMRSDIKSDYPNGMTAVTFYPASQYEILTGECMATKAGSIISGDTRSIIRIGLDKVMVALSDGMGSGEAAEIDSSTSIQMIENLYMAGFSSETILNLANNLLTGTKDESFSALDLCILDLENGFADFVKLGAVSGYIRTEHGVEVIEGGSLPLGIVDEIKPVIRRRKLKTDDLCLIISDGVIDTIGVEQIDKILVGNSALNPQVISNEIIRACLSQGIKDDVTAIAFRLYRRI